MSETDKASRSNQDLWICGYDSSVEGSAVARLEKIIGGLRNLTMVDEEAWNTYGQASATILQIAEDGLDKVPFMFNHPGSNALALRLEEAVLAVGEERAKHRCQNGTGGESRSRTTAAWQPQVSRSDTGAASSPQPNRNGSTAMGHPQWGRQMGHHARSRKARERTGSHLR